MTTSLVIPSNILSDAGGVINLFFLTINIFSPGPSHTLPDSVKNTASSKPFSKTSKDAKAEFKYAAVALVLGGSIVSEILLQLDTATFNSVFPVKLPRG